MLTATKGKYYRNGVEITEEKYNEILSMLHSRPIAPEGYGYILTESLEWELYELPPVEDDPELTAEEALDIILGEGTANFS